MDKKVAGLLHALLFYITIESIIVESACPKTLSYYNFLSAATSANGSSSGYNAVIASQPSTPQPFGFGQTYVFDMPLLAGPSLTSTLVGSVLGTFTLVSQHENRYIFVSETFIVNTTTCNGTFSATGLENISTPISSKPIVGGTGDFALVTGVATTNRTSRQILNSNFQAWFQYTFDFEFHRCRNE